MKKAIQFIACFALLAITLSAFSSRFEAPGIGYRAPAVFLDEENSNLLTMEGNDSKDFVLLTFWSSSDAASRLRINEYNTMVANNNSVRQLAVNFDRSETLFGEIVKRDNLEASEQYHVEGPLADEIRNTYHLDRGLHTFLIDPKGVIIAIDPDSEQVNSLSV